MDNQKNIIIAILLSAIVLFGWQYAIEIFYPAPPETEAVQELQGADGEIVTLDKGQADGAVAAMDDGKAAVRPRALVLAETPRVKIDAMRVRGSINLKGARIDDLSLNDYRETQAKDSGDVHLFSPAGTKDQYFAQFGWVGQGVEAPTSDTIWSASGETLTNKTPVTLSWDNAAGQKFEIILSIDDNYLISANQRFTNADGGQVAIRPVVLVNRTSATAEPSTWIVRNGPIGVFDEKANFDVDYEELEEAGRQGVSFANRVSWLGFSDHYWLSALIPGKNADGTTAVTGNFRALRTGIFQSELLYESRIVAAGKSFEQQSSLFAGAKETDLLDRYAEVQGITLLDRAIDWGWFRIIEKPIFKLLNVLFQMFGNFGVAIILLTVLIRGVMFPIAQKQFSSMAQMRAVQPKMKQLQERHKEDKQKLQQEMMKLYKQEKINPLAGCLPMFIQIPIFFALYKVLLLAIEMRHEPFYLWITDLSAPDPLTPVNLFGLIPFDPPAFIAIGILPIILGITMFIQFRLTPHSDPIQKQVFSIMPWVLMFVMAPFAAGLQLYWCANNILTIAQQKWLYSRHPQLREQMLKEAEDKAKERAAAKASE